MHDILLISASVREGRKSPRVVKFLKNYIEENKLGKAEIADLADYDFPLFEERLRNLSNPPAGLVEISEKIKNASAIIIVTPEYNGGYPASLKNLIDALFDEWLNKPVAIATVSSGAFGASQVLQQLSFVLWKMGVNLVPVKFQTAQVEKSYSEEGIPTEKDLVEKLAGKFVQAVLDAVK